MAVAFLGIFGAMGFGRFGYSAILPDMQKGLELSGAEAGSLASWNLVGYTFMAFAGGLLASRFGPRKVVTVGMVVTAGGMVLTGFADGLPEASAGRFLTGLGNGMVMAPSIALMASWFDTRHLGLASTVASSGNGLGLIVAGPAVPRIIASGGDDGWRQAWFFFAVVTMVMAALTLALERDRPSNAPPVTTPRSKERKKAGRADIWRVMSSGYAWHLGSVNFLYGFAFLIYFTFFQKRLTADLGFSSETAGSLFLAAGATSLVCGVFWGAYSDRAGRGRALGALLAVQAVAALLFGLRPGTPALVVSAIIFGSGVFSVPALIGAACGDGFGPKLAFASLGFVTVFIGCGMALGPYVGGLMEDHFSSLGPSYLLSAGVFVLSAIAALFLRDASPGRENP
jgi:predicted MFS family arabinose efflux permease